MATKRAYVFKVDLTLRVFPSVTVLRRNDDMELVNLSNTNVDWIVPAGPLAGGPVKDKVRAGGTSQKKRANPKAQVVEYQVKAGLKRARAASDPVIIIDP